MNKPMLTLKEVEWVDMLNQAGFTEVENWRANTSNDWAGTLVITGKKA